MGAYSPAPIINKIVEKKIINKIVKPTLRALKRKGQPYSGFLYVGLMIQKTILILLSTMLEWEIQSARLFYQE